MINGLLCGCTTDKEDGYLLFKYLNLNFTKYPRIYCHLLHV